jgi:hypothetical protein
MKTQNEFKSNKSKESIWDRFTNQYKLQKTLRFELKPVGKTKEHIDKNRILENDEKRADDYKMVKKIIDRYHKQFIEQSLSDFSLTKEKKQLQFYADLYSIRDKNDAQKKEFNSLKDSLRKQIAEKFKKTDGWGDLFAKELIKEHLLTIAKDDAEKDLIDEFKTFTTYFTGFHENRKNMYTHEDHATAIAYRLVHENLPKFLDNLNIFEKYIRKNTELKKEITTIEKEILNDQKITEVFKLDFFNTTLTQTGIDLYNTVLGGLSLEGQKKLKGLNEYINLCNQKQSDKNKRIPRLKPLYKQILSDRESSSFRIDAFENDNELLETIENYYHSINAKQEYEGSKLIVLKDFKALMQDISHYDREKIFIKNDTSLTQISQAAFGDWSLIISSLAFYYETCVNPALTKITKKYETEKDKWLKRGNFSIEELESALYAFRDQTDKMKEFKLTENSGPVCDYFKKCEQTVIKNDAKKGKNIEVQTDYIQEIEDAYAQVKDLLNTPYSADKKLAQDKTSVAMIKALLDAIKDFLHFVKSLHPEKVEGAKDENFYGVYTTLYDLLNNVTPLYNKVRNYLTKKPYSVEKYKLNFEYGTLGDGWDVNKETANGLVLLRKGGLYYLGIIDKNDTGVFKNFLSPENGGDVYEKLIYKQIANPANDLPNLLIVEGKTVMKKGRKNKQGINEERENALNQYLPKEINEIRIKKSYLKNLENNQKNPEFDKNDLKTYIAYYQRLTKSYFHYFDFLFKDAGEYSNWVEFTNHINTQGYLIKFQNIGQEYINQLVEEGKLYLFQIYNKDFSSYSKGKPNLHTIYWKMLFDENNLKDVVYKLNGEVEVFYRKKSLNYDARILNEGHHAAKLKGKFKYPIISNKRFAYDKFQFHVPITLNFKATGNGNVNLNLLSFLKNNNKVNIIGIDRGERHLLYLTLIDQNRNIIKQMTLNEIVNSYVKNGITFEKPPTDYHKILDEKEAERDKARKDWGVIENIKELKEGYLSHVIHVIAKMLIEHNAIVVMEDLNFGFKRGRFKVEKQVYQKFEKMLIDKLNYLVFKEHDPQEPGGVLKAYQLAGKFVSFEKLGKQSGVIFYTPAALTSKIDPVTGFVDFLKTKYENLEKAKDFFGRFHDIRYNVDKDRFEFTFDYKDFIPGFENGRSVWTVCSSDTPRYRWNKSANQNKGAQAEVLVTNELKALFKENKIEHEDIQDLKGKIVKIDDANFFRNLIFLFSTLMTLRHNNGKKAEEERDYILSPVEPFFNSLNATEAQPKNADANGAYHIALKGLWALQQIGAVKPDELKKVKLAISNKNWLHFAQEK